LRLRLSVVALATLLSSRPLPGQGLSQFDRQRGLDMLAVVRNDIGRNYFDSTFRGVALDAVFDTAEARIRGAVSVEQVLATIALTTASLNDSHTLFLPPGLTYRAEYGLKFRFVGDTCRVYEVTAGSDAEARGLSPGDAVQSVEGIGVTRANLWQLEYLLTALRAAPSLRMVVSHPGAAPQPLTIAGRIVERRQQLDPSVSVDLWAILREERQAMDENQLRWFDDKTSKVIVFRFPRFWDDPDWVNRIEKEARGHDAVIIDLRGNGGGSVEQLTRFLSLFHESEHVVAHLKRRRTEEDLQVKGKGGNRFPGKVIVLVDAASGSAAEIFARDMQLTGRGLVLGDRTAGAVRMSRLFLHLSGTQSAASYGTSVTIGDVFMADGGQLENVGVTPDEVILPTGLQMQAGHDPVLARALALAGLPVSPEQAGKAWH
jgi:C-terminal processing protease CtpA/Prc